jgi:hypothetical protein
MAWLPDARSKETPVHGSAKNADSPQIWHAETPTSLRAPHSRHSMLLFLLPARRAAALGAAARSRPYAQLLHWIRMSVELQLRAQIFSGGCQACSALSEFASRVTASAGGGIEKRATPRAAACRRTGRVFCKESAPERLLRAREAEQV